MKTTRRQRREKGIALIIVMIVVVVLAMMAGAFALAMKVEAKLARNATWDTELEWMGRSGIELARYVLGTPASVQRGRSIRSTRNGPVERGRRMIRWRTLI